MVSGDKNDSGMGSSRSNMRLMLCTFLLLMYEEEEESRRACAFMILSMLADQPYSPVTNTQGACSRRLDTTTFSTYGSTGRMDVGVMSDVLGGGMWGDVRCEDALRV